MLIYFVRHGQTVWNLEKKFQGIKNSPLTELGKEQARKLKNYLKDTKFDHFYSSPLGRAKETLAIITEDRPNVKISHIENFREIDMGEMEGVPRNIFESTYPKEFFDLWNDGVNYDPSPFKGETFKNILIRTKKGLEKLVTENKPEDKILIVSHGMALQGIFANIRNEGVESFKEKNVPKNTSFTVVEYKNGKFEIIDFSNTSHLE